MRVAVPTPCFHRLLPLLLLALTADLVAAADTQFGLVCPAAADAGCAQYAAGLAAAFAEATGQGGVQVPTGPPTTPHPTK